ncbi:MAG: DUF2231 domain-containing protein [bacterium]
MADPHPYLVHFPIALFVCAVVCELVALLKHSRLFSQTALLTSIGAAGFCVLAVISGLIAKTATPLAGEIHQVVESHETFGYGVLACTLVFAALKSWSYVTGRRKFAETLIGVGLIGLLLLVLTSHEGGELVYEHGVGVKQSTTTVITAP